jgi:tetratricopeptide (TPR) repeat protein
MTLNKLGTLYNDSKRLKEAERDFLEALSIYRDLATTNPATYQPLVATALNNLGNLYAKTRRVNEAEQAFKEALLIRWALAKANPASYQEDVSTTLHDWATIYGETKANKPSRGEPQSANPLR